MRLAFLWALMLGLAACTPKTLQQSGTPSDASTGDVERGQELAVAHCSRCHAVGARTDSPYPSAPPLNAMAARFDLDALGAAFERGIKVAHEGKVQMPPWQLTSNQADDLMAYLRAIAK